MVAIPFLLRFSINLNHFIQISHAPVAVLDGLGNYKKSITTPQNGHICLFSLNYSCFNLIP